MSHLKNRAKEYTRVRPKYHIRVYAGTGVLGAEPLGEGVAENAAGGWRRGKAFPSFILQKKS